MMPDHTQADLSDMINFLIKQKKEHGAKLSIMQNDLAKELGL